MKSLRFRIFLLALAVISISGQTAWALDTPSYCWTGWYLGAHLGGGFGNAQTTNTPLFNGLAGHDTVVPSTIEPDPVGVTGGGQIGYNMQMLRFVLGIEADLSGSAISGTSSVAPVALDGTLRSQSSILSHEDVSWFGTLRPRIGYTPIPPVLIYGTAGLAYGHANYSTDTVFPTVRYPASPSCTKAGWAAGGGIEYAIRKHWTVRAEYLFIDLGSQSAIANPIPQNPPYQSAKTWNTAFNVIDIAMNFKF